MRIALINIRVYRKDVPVELISDMSLWEYTPILLNLSQIKSIEECEGMMVLNFDDNFGFVTDIPYKNWAIRKIFGEYENLTKLENDEKNKTQK